MKFHHIGIATNDIMTSIETIKKIFDIKTVTDIIFDEIQDVNVCMLTTNNNENIELIEGKKVERYIKNATYLYHTCYSVVDINKTIAELEEKGFFVISSPQKAKLFFGKKVAFIYTDIGIIELLEE